MMESSEKPYQREVPLKRSKAELKQIADLLLELDEKRRYRTIDFFQPYEKQREFFDASFNHREVLFMAGNQLGKTEAGAAAVAYHLTGDYPADWLGRRFTKPVMVWAAGEDSTVVRDVQQKKLCGEPGVDVAFGSGLIPRECFIQKPTLAHGVSGAFDTVQVQHKTNGVKDGVSILKFKSYEAGRTKFQAGTIDIIWLDEEASMDIYGECVARITSTKGLIFTTFTPLKGKTSLVIRFMDEESPDRTFVMMTIDDVPRFTPEERAQIIAGYPAHQRDARARGVPFLGDGRIFTVSESQISEPRLEFERVPPDWCKLWAVDFGIGHPFAAILQAWDRDTDIIHILHAFKIADQTPVFHCQQIKNIGIMVPVAWPQDGTQREKSGETVSKLYKNQGLRMLDHHATFIDGGYGTEAGILEMDERMKTGRYKVAEHLKDWFEEYRNYHRAKGLIVKLRDDIMSASRIGNMARRFGQPVQLGSKAPKRRTGEIAQGLDFDVFSGQ